MTQAALPRETSFGLLGMRERVHRLNGTLSIDSTPGYGFRIAVTFPLETLERVPACRPETSPPSVSSSY